MFLTMNIHQKTYNGMLCHPFRMTISCLPILVYLQHTVAFQQNFHSKALSLLDANSQSCLHASLPSFTTPFQNFLWYEVHAHHITPLVPVFSSLQQYFGWLPVEVILSTSEHHTTKYARTHMNELLTKNYECP